MFESASSRERAAQIAREVLRHVPPSLQLAGRDRFLWAMIIVALLVNLGLFAFLIIQFSTLPPLVPLHFDPTGQPDRIEPSNTIFSLPQIGLIVIALNFGFGSLIYRREQLAAYLLAGSAIVVQFLLWFAAIQIVRIVAL
jgi:uncharacterized membrane protein